jgi:photosystem II stability/assembly factor-like uncharacterized protein
MNAQYAWVAIPPDMSAAQSTRGIGILYTTDGGVQWRRSTIPDSNAVGTFMPQFINAQDGWLEVSTGAAAGSESVDIFATTDGGQSWTKVASAAPQSSSGLPLNGHKTGLSFANASTGWATGGSAATDASWLYKTQDGGKTWRSQSLPTIKGLSNATYNTTPPVLFGANGVLPVYVNTANVHGVDLYVTHDGGTTWTPTTLNNFSAYSVYTLDMLHTWVHGDRTFSATSNGGQSWTTLGATQNAASGMSFVDTSNGWAINDPVNKMATLFHTTDGGKTWQEISYSINA